MNEHSPMQQFEVKTLVPIHIGPIDISFTNASLFMLIAAAVVASFFILATRQKSLRPGKLQVCAELIHSFASNLLSSNAGKSAAKFFPFVFTLFTFIAACNLIGMIPYTFTVTAQLAVTLSLALFIFLGATLVGFINHGFSYLRLFAPKGVPFWLLPLLVAIEVVSYFIRPVSLSVRLFANMMAGHTLLKVCASFVPALGVAGVLPVLFMSAFTGLEIVIALLQAFIFSVLTCIYLNDALHPSHLPSPPLTSAPQRANQLSHKQQTTTLNKQTHKGDVAMDAEAAKYIGAGIACIALAGAGVGIGLIFGNYVAGALRNPGAAASQFVNALIGFALAEATGLFGLVVALIILFG